VIASESAVGMSHAMRILPYWNLPSTSARRHGGPLLFCAHLFFSLPKRKLKNAFQLPLLSVCVCVCVYTSWNSVLTCEDGKCNLVPRDNKRRRIFTRPSSRTVDSNFSGGGGGGATPGHQTSGSVSTVSSKLTLIYFKIQRYSQERPHCVV
jgi:hypothetical protein